MRRPPAVGFGGDASQVNAAGAVLEFDQVVEALQQHGVHVDEVDRQDAAGLRGQELLQVGAVRRGAGSIPASCRICHTVEAANGGRA